MLTVVWQSLDDSIVSQCTLLAEITSSVMLTILAHGRLRVAPVAVSVTLAGNTSAQGGSRAAATWFRTQAIKSR